MAKRTLSAAELENHLSEQLGALQRSVQLFDDGYQLEARRIAVTLRILLRSGRYPSLLKQLGRDDIDFVDTARPFDPNDLTSTHSLLSLKFDSVETSYAAKLDHGSYAELTPFNQWWEAIVFADKQGFRMSRADVVLIAANQDGGAHVDGALNADYATLRFDNSIGWLTDKGDPPHGDPGYAAIRQVAHEVLKTLMPGYSKTDEEIRAARKKSKISEGKMRFYPHEKIFFENKTNGPLIPGSTYLAEIMVDSITTGSVRMVVNSAVTDPVTSAGKHSIPIEAGPDKRTGVFGEHTDAVIDHVSIRQMLN